MNLCDIAVTYLESRRESAYAVVLEVVSLRDDVGLLQVSH